MNLKVVEDTDGSIRNIGNDTNVSYYKGYLYYSKSKDGNKVYRIKEDGTEMTKISDDYTYYMSIADNYIYYTNSNDNDSIYKMKIDGSGYTMKLLMAPSLRKALDINFIKLELMERKEPRFLMTFLQG